MRRRRVLAALAPLLLLAACGETDLATRAEPDVAAVETFLGERLPAHARDIRTHGEQGIDGLVLLRFEAPSREAATFAEKLLGAPLKTGLNPQLGTFGTGLDWWIATPPAGSLGGSVTHASENRTFRVLVAPREGDTATLWLAAFSN